MAEFGQLCKIQKSWDPMLIAGKCTFTTGIGGTNMTCVPTKLSGIANTSNLNYTITPPSINVVMKKAPLHDVTCTFRVVCVQSDGSGKGFNSLVAMNPNGAPFAVYGRHFAVARAAPVTALTNNIVSYINNVSCTAQAPYLPAIMHALEGPRGRGQHGVTYRQPTMASWDDADGSLWGLSANHADALGDGDVGPGAYEMIYTDGTGTALEYFADIKFYDANGVVQTLNPYTNGTAADTYGSSVAHKDWTAFQYGRPVTHPLGAGRAHNVFFQIRLIDPVQCPPFAFNENEAANETGMYGVSTINLQFTLMNASDARLVQGCTSDGCIYLTNQGVTSAEVTADSALGTQGALGGSSVQLNGSGDIFKISNAQVWTYYLSQAENSVLPSRSICTYMNIQFWQQQVLPTDVVYYDGQQKGLSETTFTFNSVTLGNIPELLAVFVQPTNAPGSGYRASEADWMCTFQDNCMKQLTFCNASGNMSGWPMSVITPMTKRNGEKSSIQALGGLSGSGVCMVNGQRTIPGGGVFYMIPGKDFPLPAETGPGSAGQIQISFMLGFLTPAKRNYTVTLVSFSSGLFITDSGVSRQITVALDKAAFQQADVVADRFSTRRLLGGDMQTNLNAAASTKGKDKYASAVGAGGFAGGSESAGASTGKRPRNVGDYMT